MGWTGVWMVGWVGKEVNKKKEGKQRAHHSMSLMYENKNCVICPGSTNESRQALQFPMSIGLSKGGQRGGRLITSSIGNLSQSKMCCGQAVESCAPPATADPMRLLAGLLFSLLVFISHSPHSLHSPPFSIARKKEQQEKRDQKHRVATTLNQNAFLYR